MPDRRHVELSPPFEVWSAALEVPTELRKSPAVVVMIPVGLYGVRSLVAAALDSLDLTKTVLDHEQWSRELSLAVTNLEQAALWLLEDEARGEELSLPERLRAGVPSEREGNEP